MPDTAAAAPAAGVVFLIPPGRPPSGGDLYNQFLLRALRADGFCCETTSLERFKARPYPPGVEVWVDSLYIPKMADANPLGPGASLYFIIHSLPSLDPGLPRSAARELRLAEDRLIRQAAGFLVTGPWARDVLRARGIDRPIFLVPPAPCILPKGPRNPPFRFTGLIVSSLIRGKGVPDFLDALGREVRAADEFSLRIAGRTDIEPATASACLRAVAAHPLLGRIVAHLGNVPYEKLGPEYEKSSVFISPSTSETFGMAFHEARAFSLPILAVRAPYSDPFLADGRAGLLFGSAAALARGTLDLVRRPERLQALAAAAGENRTAGGYTWADAARSFLSQREAWTKIRACPSGNDDL